MLNIKSVKRAINAFREWYGGIKNVLRQEQSNPTCIFYQGSYVDPASKLGKYNVLFKNVSLVNSEIGDHTFVQKDTVITNATIGKFCSIASRVRIGLGQHPVHYVSTHPAFYSVNQPIAKTFSSGDYFDPYKRITVGSDVWIGDNAMIMDGVTVADGAVIAAGAIVTKDIPAYAIVGGVPARVIKYRFDEKTREKLSALKWWDKPEEWLKENAGLFRDPEKIIAKTK